VWIGVCWTVSAAKLRAYAAGLKLAWVPSAIVTEEVPTERLTASYLSQRAQAQTITKFGLMKAAKPKLAPVMAIAQILSKGISGVFRVLLSPLLGRYTYYRGIRAFGIAHGFWSGLRGVGQAGYTKVTGE